MGTEALKPIDCRQLLSGVTDELLTLLGSLAEEDWEKRTCYPAWRVRHIVAHLIQTGLSRLSAQRDGYPDRRLPSPLPFGRLSSLIAASNDLWERVFQTVSPRLLLELISVTERDLADFLLTQDLTAEAYYAVTWAGEDTSAAWFDIAREFTERWHHQEQIREAVGAPTLMRPVYLRPVLDTLVRAVPYWYSPLSAADGTTVSLIISGPSGGSWTLRRSSSEWNLFPGAEGAAEADASISLSDDLAWRFLTRSVPVAAAAPFIRFSHDSPLCRQFLAVKAIMMED